MKHILLIILSLSFISAKSQIERLSVLKFNTYLEKQLSDVYFCIMKRDNPREEIKDYKAYLIVDDKDTVNIYHDSIITRHLNYRRGASEPMIPVTLIVEYGGMIFKIPDFEHHVGGFVNNIWFIINGECTNTNYVLRSTYGVFHPESEKNTHDIYAQPLEASPGHSLYSNDRKAERINSKKNKHIIPDW
jgi:hypothetical protein